jgi:hypothetical protein
MERNELIQQYDRYISQVKEEAKDLYWLYNFFFVVNSALIGSVFIGKLNSQYLLIAKIIGILLSIYWLIIVRKQRLWRNNWVTRIQYLEEKLSYEEDIRMWSKKDKTNRTCKSYIFGRYGLWRFLFGLPIGFMIVWTVLLFY